MALPAEKILEEFTQLSVKDQVHVGHEVLTRLLQLIARTDARSPDLEALLKNFTASPAPGGPRPLGLLRGQWKTAEDFDAPLPDSVLNAFESGT